MKESITEIITGKSTGPGNFLNEFINRQTTLSELLTDSFNHCMIQEENLHFINTSIITPGSVLSVQWQGRTVE